MNIAGEHNAAVVGTTDPRGFWLVFDEAGLQTQQHLPIEFRGDFGWFYLREGEARTNGQQLVQLELWVEGSEMLGQLILQ